MRVLLASSACVLAGLALSGCSSEPALSLDQQQQAWEQEQEALACDQIEDISPGAVETGRLFRESAKGNISAELIKQQGQAETMGPYNCHDWRFDLFLEERLVEEFPGSPKGQAGETTKPAPR